MAEQVKKKVIKAADGTVEKAAEETKKTVKKVTYAPVKKTSSRTLAVRIFCIALAAIMVLGVAYYLILVIGGKI